MSTSPCPKRYLPSCTAASLDYLAERDQLFVFRGFVGADPVHAMRIQVVNEYAWQNLFARQLFIRPIKESLQGFSPEFTVIAVPGLKVDPAEMGTNSEAFIVISFAERVVLIGGTGYAGGDEEINLFYYEFSPTPKRRFVHALFRERRAAG